MMSLCFSWRKKIELLSCKEVWGNQGSSSISCFFLFISQFTRNADTSGNQPDRQKEIWQIHWRNTYDRNLSDTWSTGRWVRPVALPCQQLIRNNNVWGPSRMVVFQRQKVALDIFLFFNRKPIDSPKIALSFSTLQVCDFQSWND